jgi:hypothetical protein
MRGNHVCKVANENENDFEMEETHIPEGMADKV